MEAEFEDVHDESLSSSRADGGGLNTSVNVSDMERNGVNALLALSEQASLATLCRFCVLSRPPIATEIALEQNRCLK